MCFLKGSLVLLERGYTRIEEIIPEDKIVVFGELEKNMNFVMYKEPKYEKIICVGAQNSQRYYLSEFKIDSLGKNVPFEKFFPTRGTRILDPITNRFKNSSEFECIENIYDKYDPKFIIPHYHILTNKHLIIKINGVLTETIIEEDIDKMESIFPINFEDFNIPGNTVINIKRDVDGIFVDLDVKVDEVKV
jgi:hypothetical protein